MTYQGDTEFMILQVNVSFAVRDTSHYASRGLGENEAEWTGKIEIRNAKFWSVDETRLTHCALQTTNGNTTYKAIWIKQEV